MIAIIKNILNKANFFYILMLAIILGLIISFNKKQKWPFDGIFGFVDYQAAQRGYQVYKEVCASCHSMQNMKFNNLTDLGFSEAEAKTLAQEFTISDDFDDKGSPITRKRELKDSFPSPYQHENQAISTFGIVPTDLSLIIKARHDGANYVYNLLTTYKEKPANVTLEDGAYYNQAFPGNIIKMPPPLSDEIITYQDGTKASVENMARDVVIFLQYVSEPEMQTRKSLGLKVIIFLIIFSFMCYLTKNIIWEDIKHNIKK